jgi:hypothetical protein
MCRSKADGGRRCDGNHDGHESYEGTPWQGYDEYQERSAELDRRIAAGETMTGIMQAEQFARGQAMIDRIKREGW